MYTKRIQLINYGPIEKLDIEFPFNAATPKPVVLVGENGSGKSILLSHIVNGLLSARERAYPDSPEVESGRVYKFRTGSYIRSGSEYYFAKVDFEEGLSVTEMHLKKQKGKYKTLPPGVSESGIQDAWRKIIRKRPTILTQVPFPKAKLESRISFQKGVFYIFLPTVLKILLG